MEVFLHRYGAEIGRLTFEHLWLTVSAMLWASAIGLPLGVLLTRKRALARPVLTVANILQTIPSLALFGLLLPVPFLGDRAARLAIVALTGYALLPIIRKHLCGDQRRGSGADRRGERVGNDGAGSGCAK